MSDLAGMRHLLHGGGLTDPKILADQLAGMDPGRLREAAYRAGALGQALTVAETSGHAAGIALAQGWSARSPGDGISRLVSTVAHTAAVLLRHHRSIEDTAAVLERAKTDAALDVALAVAELNRLKDRPGPGFFEGVFGNTTMSTMQAIEGVLRRVAEVLDGHARTVETAVSALRAALSEDPTAGPDSLRGGTDALLPPDPVMNPVNRIDQQNRAALARDLHSGDRTRITFALSILQSLQHAGDRGGRVELVVYDSAAFAGQGRAAISVGDLTMATSVAVLVPGILNSPSSMSGGLDLAADLRDEASRQRPDEATAVIAWYGYDIPLSFPADPDSSLATDIGDTMAAGWAANARAGAPILAADLTAIKSMSQSSARITVLGFSMGSTTVSEAAKFPLPVDSIVLMGSPGAGWDTDTAAGYQNIAPSDVFVVSYDSDPVTKPVTDRLAGAVFRLDEPYGPDPAAKAFGATDVDVTSNVPMTAGTPLIALLKLLLGDPRQHSMKNYMTGGALRAEGAIVVGRKDKVPTKPGR